jgi:hypothetical protein
MDSTFLPFLIPVVSLMVTLLSFRHWWLLPSAIIFPMSFGYEGFGFVLAIFSMLVLLRRQGLKMFGHRANLMLSSLSFGAMALFYGQGFFTCAIWMLLPWVLYPQVQYWLSINSGGGAMLIPLVLMALFEGLVWAEMTEPSRNEGASFVASWALSCFFFALIAWYRQLPVVILLFSSCFVVLMMTWLFMINEIEAMILLAALLSCQMLDKWFWGRGKCQNQFWGWASFVLLAMGFALWKDRGGSAFQPSLFGLFSLLLLVWMGQQETCRLCVSVARCREMLVSLLSARAPLVVLLVYMFCGISELGVIFLMFSVMFSEGMRQTALRPVTADQILQSPCRKTWAQRLRKSLSQ